MSKSSLKTESEVYNYWFDRVKGDLQALKDKIQTLLDAEVASGSFLWGNIEYYSEFEDKNLFVFKIIVGSPVPFRLYLSNQFNESNSISSDTNHSSSD